VNLPVDRISAGGNDDLVVSFRVALSVRISTHNLIHEEQMAISGTGPATTFRLCSPQKLQRNAPGIGAVAGVFICAVSAMRRASVNLTGARPVRC
jgi:hypothetical protein